MSRRSTPAAAALLVLVALVLGGTPARAVTPDNDRVEHAKTISSLPYRDETDTSDATASPSDPECFGKVRTVWYRYSAAADAQVAFSTLGSGYDTNVAVYVGTPDEKSQLACVDNSRGTEQARVSVGTFAGETYYIRVGASGEGQGGSLVFTAEQVAPPPNDDISAATPIAGLPFTTTEDTSEASAKPSDPTCVRKLRTVWFTLTPHASDLERGNVVTLTTAGSDYAATVSVYTGDPSSLHRVACAGGATSFEARAGERYFVMVGSQTVDGGTLRLSVESQPPPPPPANVKLRVNRAGFESVLTGDAAVQGFMRCSKPIRVTVAVTLRQHKSRASSSDRFGCDKGRNVPWSVSVSGSFHDGEAAARVFLYPSDGGATKKFEGTVELVGCTLIGTSGRDKLTGLGKDDILCGLAGNDHLVGRGGDDLLRGGGGKDRLDGGPGNDFLQGSGEADVLIGGPGADKCFAGGDKGDKLKGCETKITGR